MEHFVVRICSTNSSENITSVLLNNVESYTKKKKKIIIIIIKKMKINKIKIKINKSFKHSTQL